MADTKNEHTKETPNATGELNWSGSQQGHGVKVEVKEKKQSDSTAETANNTSSEVQETGSSAASVSETPKSEPVQEADASTVGDEVVEEGSKRQTVSFIVGLIIGALLTSILI